MDRIYLRQPDGTLRGLELQPYDSEDLLQELLARYPDLLAGDQMNEGEPRRWLLVSREAGIPGGEGEGARWSLDHLFLDQDGVPTLVEVKRSSDTRIRREVVGQMLDYAANAVTYWPVETIRATFEARCEASGDDPAETCVRALGLDDGDSGAVETLWQRVRVNLQAGNVRMVFVADEIPSELRRVIEFLDAQMDPAEVLGVEVKQYVGDGLQSLVPRVVGQSAITAGRKDPRRAGEPWDEERFLQELRLQTGESEVEVARSILRWIEPKVSRIWWGSGRTQGSYVPILDLDGDPARVHFFAVWTYGATEIYFQFLQNKPPFDDRTNREELRRRLNGIPGVDIPADALAKRPSIPLQRLVEADSMARFREAIEWGLGKVRAEFAVRESAD